MRGVRRRLTATASSYCAAMCRGNPLRYTRRAAHTDDPTLWFYLHFTMRRRKWSGGTSDVPRDKRRIRRALVDKSCDGGRRGRRTDRGAGLGRRAGTIDRCRGGAADAAGTGGGCGGGDRRRMRRRGQAADAAEAAGGTGGGCGGWDMRREGQAADAAQAASGAIDAPLAPLAPQAAQVVQLM